jgi:hypothetical protein
MLISIIIPTKDRVDLLSACIDSILDLFTEFLRPNIINILDYLKNKKNSNCCLRGLSCPSLIASNVHFLFVYPRCVWSLPEILFFRLSFVFWESGVCVSGYIDVWVFGNLFSLFVFFYFRYSFNLNNLFVLLNPNFISKRIKIKMLEVFIFLVDDI